MIFITEFFIIYNWLLFLYYFDDCYYLTYAAIYLFIYLSIINSTTILFFGRMFGHGVTCWRLNV